MSNTPDSHTSHSDMPYLTTGTILDDICKQTFRTVQKLRSRTSINNLQDRINASTTPRDFAAALIEPGLSVIAEIKKASPSAGSFDQKRSVTEIAQSYESNGARAISVLTEQANFDGSPADLTAVKKTTKLPVLRKDFIFTEYQLYQSRVIGTDAVLLIAAILPDELLAALYQLTYNLDMQALVEVHTLDELKRVFRLKPDIIGINNRDLKTLTVDLETFGRLAPQAPRDTVLVAESAITSRADLAYVASHGADAVLVGTTLMNTEDPGKKLSELLKHDKQIE